jgi:hypothetical protein
LAPEHIEVEKHGDNDNDAETSEQEAAEAPDTTESGILFWDEETNNPEDSFDNVHFTPPPPAQHRHPGLDPGSRCLSQHSLPSKGRKR